MSDIMNNLPKNTDNNHRREETFMRKKYSVFFIAFAIMLTFGIFCGFTLKQKVFADSENVFKSKSVILTDYNSGTVIAEQNSKQHLPIASMCKIMTLLLTFEQIDKGALNFDENIAVSETAAGMGGSQVFLEAGALYKTSDLIKSIVVASANDACVAIAETIAGSEDSFVFIKLGIIREGVNSKGECTWVSSSRHSESKVALDFTIRYNKFSWHINTIRLTTEQSRSLKIIVTTKLISSNLDHLSSASTLHIIVNKNNATSRK